MKMIKHFLFFIASSLILLDFSFCGIPMYANDLELPAIPARPTLETLRKSLNVEKSNVVKVRNLSNDIMLRTASFQDYLNLSGDYFDNHLEMSFAVSFVKLFSLALHSIESLNLSIKTFDSSAGKIVASDKFKNIFLVTILNQDKNKSKLEIYSHASPVGKIALLRTSKKLLNKVYEATTN